MNFEDALRELINTHSKENESNTPDFILTQYIGNCLNAFTMATQQRETWYGRNAQPTFTVGKTNKPLHHDTKKPSEKDIINAGVNFIMDTDFGG